MSEYTPDTEEVFIMWECLLWEGIASEESMKDADWDGDRMRAQLSRWLDQVKAEAWDEGAKAERDYQWRHEDADAAGQGVMISRKSNPYLKKA